MEQNTFYTKTEKLLSTFHTLFREFPDYPGIWDLEGFTWSEHCDDGSGPDPDLVEIFIEALEKFLEQAETNQIDDFFNRLQSEQELRPAMVHVKEYINGEHMSYFDSDVLGIPTQFTRPMIPFFPANRNSGAMVRLSEPIIQKSGKTTMEIDMVAMFPRDVKTLKALTAIMTTKTKEVYKNGIVSFKTTLAEIAMEIGSSYPHSKDVQNAIMNSLKRMRACTITWTNTKGKKTCNGILSQWSELEEDSAFEISIDFYSDFLDLYKYGYADFDKAIYDMNDREINAYMFFEGQVNYKKSGKFNMNILRLYDRMNLDAPGSHNPDRKKRYTITQLLKKCEKLGIIGDHEIDKTGHLWVNKSGELFRK